MGLLRLFVVALAVAPRGMALAGPTPAPTPPAPVPSGVQCLGSACFGLFWAARGFLAAGGACRAGGGRLMTVRSTVAAEAIALLLRDGPAHAWLGLRLPEGACRDPAKRLRGFQWAPGDERTDFAAWAEAPGEAAPPLCGPRCVVVTRALRWRERACEAPADGFLCEYSYPGGTCAPLSPPPPPARVSYLTPFGTREADLVALPPGTTAEVPGLGASLECRAHRNGSRWAAPAGGAWDCRLENGGCEGRCRWDGAGRPFCTCPGGAALLEGDGRGCRSPCAQRGCQHHCVAREEEDDDADEDAAAAACMCFEGYVLHADGRRCTDLDDCAAEPGPCEQECVNTPGGFECRCFAGFVFLEGKCQEDMLRCFDLSCQHECTLVGGTHRCTCFAGYVPNSQRPNECVSFCNQTQCPAQCDPNVEDTCECPDGYIYDIAEDNTTVCTDIDECHSGECGELECINTPGSYSCVCPNGRFVQDQKLCEEEEEELGGSGETEVYPRTPIATLVPPKDGSSRGMLVGIIVSTILMGVMVLAIFCYLVKRHRSSQTRKDSGCQQPESGVVLQQVNLNSASSRQKM